MKELNFETGLISYHLNGRAEASFNPTDPAFVERLFNVFDSLDQKQVEYEAARGENSDPKKFFDFARKVDAEMRTMIDEMLGTPACGALFGEMNVYAMADGLPVWCNLMFAIMDEIDTSFAREQKVMNPRIQKYTAKYQK